MIKDKECLEVSIISINAPRRRKERTSSDSGSGVLGIQVVVVLGAGGAMNVTVGLVVRSTTGRYNVESCDEERLSLRFCTYQGQQTCCTPVARV